MSDARYGYGALRAGFRDHVANNVRFDGRASSTVWMGLPDHFPGALDGAYKTLFTMVETDKVPDEWLPFLAEFDQIIVPCEANVATFSVHHPNVVKVPLGVDQSVWFPVERVVNRSFERFRFHCGGSLVVRKGLDLVVDAFLLAGLDAELHIKVAPHCRFDMPKITGRDDIVVHREWMSITDLVDWFRLADCFVAPSRGEGFGLMGLQAIACGVPTILSNTSGHYEYWDLAACNVPTRRVAAPDGGHWDEARCVDVGDAMQAVYRDAVGYRSAALEQVGEVGRFSWENASKRLLEVLPVGELLGDTGQFVPCQPLVTVQIGKTCAPDIAGVRYKFIAGKEYRVPVNVRDVLSVSGHLIV